MWVNKSLERFPQSSILLAAKGVVLARQGLIERAIGFSDSSLQVSGDSPFVWMARAQVFLSARNPDAADHSFTKALEGRDRDWKLLQDAGRIYLAAEDAARAQIYFEMSTQIHPKNAFTWWNLGVGFERSAQFDRAKECYQKAVQLDPYHDMFHRTLKRFTRENGLFGRLYKQLNKWLVRR